MERVGGRSRRRPSRPERGGIGPSLLCAAGGVILAGLTVTLVPQSTHWLDRPFGPRSGMVSAQTAPPGASDKAPPMRTMAVGGLLTLKHEGREIGYYQARPEGEGPWPGVLLASSGWGIDAELKGLADRLAAAGFFVMAPEINRGKVANDADKAREMGVLMDAEAAAADLNLLAAHLKFRQEIGDHRVGLVGLDAGGRTALMAARLSEDLSCVVTAHSAPELDVESLRRINMPILALFGADDPVTPASAVAAFREALDKAGRTWEVKVYDGAGRGFLHPKEKGYSEPAAADAFSLIVAFLRSHL